MKRPYRWLMPGRSRRTFAQHGGATALALAVATLWLLATPLGGVGIAAAQTERYLCPLTFVVEDERIPPVGITALGFDVGYLPGVLDFAGHGANVDCSKLVEGATASFVDDDAGKLHVGLDSETGLSSLITPLARCMMLSHSIPIASDVTLTLLEEKQLGGADVTPPVAVEMLLPEQDECELVTTTTSTTNTSTTSTTSTSTTSLPTSSCGDPTGDAATTATDALLTLNAAVGLIPCDLCECDVDGSAAVTASDALFILNYAVGQPVSLGCPPCS